MDQARTKHQGPRTKDGTDLQRDRRRSPLVAMMLLVVPIALGAQASRMDFVRGVEIRTDAGASLFRVRLPDDVYDTSTRADLADMRVLNAAGETVPYTFRTVPRGPSQESEWRTVPSFPMTETHIRGRADPGEGGRGRSCA